MSISSLFLEDFGQKVDLTRRIREVLLNYPEGTTILKELVQNADDAGARAFKLCLDRRSHGERSLLSETLAEWQGPALLAYNDAVFGEDDFVSISRIGGSGKRKQGWKTGRFGVGFNSVYHLTDLPSFVSGKHVVLFDPQSSYLPNISSANPGKRIDFVSSNALSLNEDQFLPYCAFGCDMKKHFNGTLFRFPLRNADQAGKSRLSTQAYADDDIHSMFTQFYDEGVFALLFLKSVVSIEMYIWDVGELEPRKLYSCSVKSVDDDAVSHRQLLLRLSKSCSSGGEIDAFQLDFLSQAMSGSCCQERVDSFYIVQNMASATSRIAALATCASKDFDMHLLPWASVAACISTDLGNDKTLKVGRAFCFLPLPVRTGLAVQVNGYFEVSSNRRGIWYGEDMDRSGKVRSLWNRLLLEDVVAPAFLQLLLSVQGILGHSELYYSLWPSGEFDEPWNILVECIYKIAAQAPVLCAEIEGGKWIAPAEAFLHDKEFRRSDELGHVLVQLGMPIVHLPNFLCDMLLKQSKEFHQKVVTHDTVRHFLREFGSGKIGRPQKLLLLEYCLEDLIDSDVGRHAYNLPLVPLGNGQDGSLSEASKGTSYFICNELEYVLLEQISDRVVNRGIPGEIFSRLSAIAESSGANLIVFTLGHFVQLFDQFVPSAWRYKSKVLWKLDVGRYSGPSPAWFRLLWEYLGCECKSLSLFDAWPILPSTSGHLYRASRLSKLIDIGGLSERMRLILDKVGCKILDCNYGVKHPELSQYVSDTNGAAVLESIFHAVSSSYSSLQIHISDLESEEKNELRIFLLDPKWYFNSVMAEPEIHKCKQLPIFMVYFLESPQSFHFCNLVESQKYLPPLDVPSSFLGNEFISTSSSLEDEILQKFYGLPRMGKAHFYRRMVFNRFSSLQPEDRDQIMLALIRDLPQLCIEDSSFKEILRNTEFIPTRTGAVKCPTDLYDPRNEELHALLEEADLFPCGVFEESNVLDALQSLGLRTSVSLDTIIQCARHIEAMRQVDLQSACLRGKVLLSYLEANAHRWVAASSSDDKRTLNRMISRAATALRPRTVGSDLDKFWSDLRVICWCPVVVSAPYPTLPWPAVSSAVAPPKLVRLKTDMWLASGSMRILDGECSSTALSYHLGWSSPIGGSVIAAQLLELGKNNDFVTDQVFRQELAQVMPRIYARLAELTGSDEMDVVKAILEGSRWIWVGDGFATSDEVVLSGPLHLAPYIRVIPVDLAVFKKLFLELSVPEILNFADYANILCRMAAHKGEDSLTAQELTAAILVVQHLAEAQYQDKHVNIFLPDTSGRLFSTFDLVYNDAPWLLGMENSSRSLASLDNAPVVSLKSKRAGRKFVHGHISNDVAEKLGVCSLRRLLLSESADSMNLGLSGAAEAFGQHEALTTRLKHILEMYANGPGTLFELVQNAEDAGASKVVFLLDKTHFGTSSVLSPDMADWQGPALYCYNDSVFSQQDLYAISRIGQESKLEKPFAIGRFGLGFNSVYHFTDVPSFVSGENVVMFDPHACNLPGISPTHPGLRIRFVGRTILEQFPDQFSPFLYFGCDLQHLFPGTLFRFPLRSPSVAHRSQIKKEAYSPEDVISLFSSFSKVVSETLLFLRKVKSISIFVKDGSSEMQLIHHCDRYTLMDPESQSHAANDMFEYIHGVKQLNMDKDQLLKKLRKSIDKDLPWICQKVFVREESTSGKFLHRWIVSECLGGGSDDSDSATLATRSLNCVPWAAVAARVLSAEVNDESSEASIAEDLFASNSGMSEMVGFSLQQKNDFEGRAFCFLPLPMNTGLPVHVNAYFELTSNRRDIWLGNDMSGGGKKRSDWNKYLLEHVAAPAYARLLEKMAVEVGPSDMFFSFWPTGMMVEPWSSMQQKLYLYITDYGVRVLYTKAKGGWWITTKQALFPDFTFSKMHLLVDILSEAGFTVVTLSQPLVERFMEAQPSLHYLTPHLLRTLLIRRKYGFSERRAMLLMLEYCLLDLRKPVRPDCLYGLSLLPLADGSSATFNRLGIDERIYIAKGEDYGLLKDSIPSQLVDMDIPDEIYGKLCDVAQSEVSNISFLSPQLLEKLFLRILPVDWQNVKQVDWVPGHDGQPSLEWMKLLWSYLRSSCNDLSVFSKWPILPVGSNYLQQLVKNSNIIEDYGWSENLSSLLLKVGCQFLRQDIAIEHPQLHNYVQSATAAGISNAFLSLAGSVESVEVLFSDAIEGELHELRSFFLQSKWYSETHMLDMQIEVLKHIPMFESYKSRKLVSLSNGIKWLKPSNVREDFLDDSFIRAESEKERIILNKYLNVREASKAEFYKDYVLNQMPRFLPSQEAVFAILQDVKMLLKEDSSLKAALSSTPFVLASNGIWQHPCRLYDPRIPELRAMLHRDVFFPSGNFSDPETLDMLVGLGLKQRLGYTGLLDCARSVSICHDQRDAETVVQGRRLLACLDAVASKLHSRDGLDDLGTLKNHMVGKIYHAAELGDSSISEFDWDVDLFLDSLIDDGGEEDLWSELKAISWCPICADPPLLVLPWLRSSDLVAVPSIVRPKSQMWTVSSSMHILDAECRSTYVQSKLGWMDLPKADVLCHQLIALAKSYAQVSLGSAVNLDFEVELQKGITSLYSTMQEILNIDNCKAFQSALQGVPCIWIGDGFVPAHILAFDSPVKFHPYLYVVPSELSEFRDLLLALGVKLSLEASDYLTVLQRLYNDMRGSPLSRDQLSFVTCVLEAVADCYIDKTPAEVSNAPILIPDSHGILMFARDLVYNDAPWMENSVPGGRSFVHPTITNDLATRLGVTSLRFMSLVDEEMAKDLPCMGFGKICELLRSCKCNDFLLFDLLELADCCGTKRLHFIYDKRDHPRQSMLQNNLGEYQGPALLVILEGTTLSREEISSLLQLLPPWRLRSHTLNYGLGLLSSYLVCDLLSVMSGGYYYMFDPNGLALAPPSSHSPAARMFSLTGTNLTQRFRDQFSPMFVGQNTTWVGADSTVFRLPLSSKFMEEGLDDGSRKIKQMFDDFKECKSRILLFLRSVLQVTLSTMDEGILQPIQEYGVSIDSSSSIIRNPFLEKKWRKFQISRLFSSSATATTKMHVIDVNWFDGKVKVADRWLVVLSMGSGQTRNMALDRRYLAYNLTPVAGIAALISRNNRPTDPYSSSPIMSPLPLSTNLSMPVTFLGCFLVRHNEGRYLFKVQEGNEVQPDAGNQLIEAWNRELMACVCDSYIDMILEFQKIRKAPLGAADEHNISLIIGPVLKSFTDNCYSIWPRSHCLPQVDLPSDAIKLIKPRVPKADWVCIIDRVVKPFYARVAELPVWQLYSGSLVKADEGMFLAQPSSAVGDALLPATVCHFVKEHYPVFSVPWDLLTEIQAVGVEVREIKPKMVRDLLRVSGTSIVMRSVEAFVDVLEYCLSDILLPDSTVAREAGILEYPVNPETFFSRNSMSTSSIHGLHGISTHGPATSGGDALEMMSSLGKALFDIGRGVIEDIGKTGGSLAQRNATTGSSSSVSGSAIGNGNQFFVIAAELRGLPFPTAVCSLARLGMTDFWIGNREQQELLEPLIGNFIHLNVLDRPILANILSNSAFHAMLKLQRFSLPLLAKNMSSLFHESWVNHVMKSNMVPWFSWENNTNSGGEGGPSPEWIKLFWSVLHVSSDDLPLFADWPLIPAFLGRPILCRVRERHIVFIPPPILHATPDITVVESRSTENMLSALSVDPTSLSETAWPYFVALKTAQSRYPWLFSLLNQCNIPLYDPAFLDCAAQCDCLPAPGKSLGQVIASKLVAAKHAGYFPELTSFLASDREDLFNLFVADFSSNSSTYGREELEVLRGLPIYRTVIGSFMRIEGQDLCVVTQNSFLKPSDEHCLACATGSGERLLLIALGVPELSDQQILVKFALPQFEGKTQSEQEDVLIYIYMNWQDLQADSSVVESLKETKFVRHSDEFSLELSRPKDLFDPTDALLMSVFSGERKKFPGERFSADGWLRILKKLGLRTASEADVIIECAKRIEFLGCEHMKQNWDQAFCDSDLATSLEELPFELWSLAESVVGAIFSNFANLYSNNFCDALGKIVCVPALRGFPNMAGKRGGKRVLTSYNGAILLKDWPLAWSCAPILSKPTIVPPEYSWGALHLRSPPPFSTVLKHLQIIGRDGGGDTLAHWPAASNMKTVEETACEVLQYLDKAWDSLSSLDSDALQKVAFLPAANGTRLVKANSLFVRLTVNLSPFAFELPTLYLPFLRILKNLGLRESLSVDSAKDLLVNLQRACGYQRLNPNELRAAVEILHFICDETGEAIKSSRSSFGDMNFVVPDDCCRLIHARSCVYIDSYGSRFVKYIDSSQLRFIHPIIHERICTSLGIKKLSEVVVEELVDEDHLLTVESIGSVSIELIRQKLLSRPFHDAVYNVLSGLGSFIPTYNKPLKEEIQFLLKDAARKLLFVSSIYTRFRYLPRSLDITKVPKETTLPGWSEGSRHRALYFVNHAKTHILISEPPNYISVLDLIAIVISDILQSPTSLPLGSLFSCPENFEGMVVDILKLFCDTKGGETMGSATDFIGKEIMAQDAHQVQIHPMRPFYMGEIVAWRWQNGEKLKYGRVPEDVRPSAGKSLYRLKVETASGATEMLLSSQVFSFRNVSENNRPSTSAMLDDGHAAMESKIDTKSQELGPRGKEPSSQARKGKDIQVAPVSPEELVQAVQEMLSAAGISMDTEKQSLVRTTVALQEKLKESQEALVLEQDKADAAAKEVDNAKAAWQCRICLSVEVQIALVPCGHVLCRRCSSAVSRCPFCRVQVSKAMKIFRP